MIEPWQSFLRYSLHVSHSFNFYYCCLRPGICHDLLRKLLQKHPHQSPSSSFSTGISILKLWFCSVILPFWIPCVLPAVPMERIAGSKTSWSGCVLLCLTPFSSGGTSIIPATQGFYATVFQCFAGIQVTWDVVKIQVLIQKFTDGVWDSGFPDSSQAVKAPWRRVQAVNSHMAVLGSVLSPRMFFLTSPSGKFLYSENLDWLSFLKVFLPTFLRRT